MGPRDLALWSLAMSEDRISEYALMILGVLFIASPWVMGFERIDNIAMTAWVVGAITFVAGVVALLSAHARIVANVLATGSYIVVTLLLYDLFSTVNRMVSAIAALVSLAGLTVGVLNMLGIAPFTMSPLVFFGIYCLLIGYLIVTSAFMPRPLGVLMACGGLGWLTFAAPSLAQRLSPYNLAPGMMAEGVLTVWLLVIGLNPDRWAERAGAAGAAMRTTRRGPRA